MALGGNDFNAIRISLASPDQIRIWSYGEVAKPETINYRTLRPEKDGLFCERIFGPTKDWECYCGKYKKIRYKGVICDRCGVEVARAKVRRERMGHITLAAPVAHIWFSKGTPSRLGLMLDLSPRNLDRVLYFAQYLITNVDSELQAMRIEELQNELDDGVERIESEGEAKLEELNGQLAELGEPVETDDEEENPDDPRRILEAEIHKVTLEIDEKRDELEEDLASQIDDLESLGVGGLLTESRYRELRDQFAGIFEAGMGAEAVLQVLGKLDIEELREHLREEMQSTSGQRRKKAIKRMSVVEAFRNSGNKPEWMVLTSLPVLPPELRPMVQLDGGRFATSDLNDLYRRVINRNNRLKRLIDLSAPEIIVRNEKRMLQESVDALVDNGRRGRAVAGSHNHRLKSLSDLLRGKQGRFRQNLLGKRVDYSGRSVIIAGPELKLHQCGLPRRMALELFKPFVMNRLVMKGYAHNIKSAKRMAERIQPAVWDILEDVVKDRLVLLNRAPTLHRLGIQAFEPVLIDGSAIQLHPLVCTAFNADFDGDQMAVHVPLSREAVLEAKQMMLSTYNMLSPSSGEPIVAPTLDIVLGTYYMTIVDESARGAGRAFSSAEDALLAHELGSIELRAPITVTMEGEQVETTAGRIIINDTLPDEMEFKNEEIEKGVLKDIVAEVYTILGNDGTAEVLDQIKNLGFHYATQAGITIAISDVEVPREKESIIADAESDLDRIEELYLDGFVTEQGRYEAAVSVWTNANNKLTQVIQDNLESYGGIYLMANSGAKGNIAQIKQMAGMRGLMSDPKGRIIDRPIKSNFREGLSVLEYFISTHGARKGLTDTALNTAHSGYLTRRLIDVSQEIIILSDDCGTPNGIWVHADDIEEGAAPYLDQIRTRYLALPVADPNTGEILFERNDVLDDPTVEILQKAGVRSVMVRSPMTCECERGICQMCYGLSLANMRPSMIGEAVGIIAAQSIGEPGTQLTMRTFHTGGVAGEDITSGMPRVQELFEARAPKGEAVLSEIDGTVEVVEEPDYRSIRVSSIEEYTDEYFLPEGFTPKVEDGSLVNIGEMLAEPDEDGELDDESAALATPDLMARVSGKVSIDGDLITIAWTDEEQREYKNIPAASHITVRTGDSVTAGAALTEGAKNPKDILRIQGRDAVQRYLIDEVQKVYRSQGVPIHNKHIELIISQMLRNVEIDDPGDTDLLPDDRVDRRVYEQRNAEVLAEGGEPATATPVLLGITRASLNTDSFLSAASFQETTRVLTESAVNGKVDHLRGLKENVIIGRLIPARLNLSEDGVSGLSLEEANSSTRGMGVMTTGTSRPEVLLGPGDEFGPGNEFGLGPDFVSEAIDPEPVVMEEMAEFPSDDND
ncbi:MAG: DNA-directed RNA polymerase subunit beta' [Dehalococcoidia bacterium]|nr:DNA-directed RNA polymerase subunit beta' [Dehalococcoidia bacterium]